jgi:DNA-binding PadR family transcriptional regulator
MEVLLGLLAIEPMSGYDLGLTIRASVGHFWNESYGQIYPNLKKLANGGFVSCRTERQKGKPNRHIYAITEKGRERLRKWLAVPPQPEIPRNELLLKLFFGEQVSTQILIGYVERMAEEHRAVLDLLEQAALLENGCAFWANGDESASALGGRDTSRTQQDRQETTASFRSPQGAKICSRMRYRQRRIRKSAKDRRKSLRGDTLWVFS